MSSDTLTATGATLTAGQTAVFSAIAGSPITVLVSGTGTFCIGDGIMFTTEVSGGTGPYTYLWSDSLGTSATATPSVTAAGTVLRWERATSTAFTTVIIIVCKRRRLPYTYAQRA